MGDKRRFIEFACFISRTFPESVRVADVAGGHGELSYRLLKLGREPVIIDPREAPLPRWAIHELRKRSIRSGRWIAIQRIQRSVDETNLSAFDLIAALHPDEATEPAIRAALRYDLSFAVVPCCVYPLDDFRGTRHEWRDHLRSLAPDIYESTLPIEGANVVLWRRSSVMRFPLIQSSAFLSEAECRSLLESERAKRSNGI